MENKITKEQLEKLENLIDRVNDIGYKIYCMNHNINSLMNESENTIKELKNLYLDIKGVKHD